jgi:cbb3-type cytochrome oxidase subunit 3
MGTAAFSMAYFQAITIAVIFMLLIAFVAYRFEKKERHV